MQRETKRSPRQVFQQSYAEVTSTQPRCENRKAIRYVGEEARVSVRRYEGPSRDVYDSQTGIHQYIQSDECKDVDGQPPSASEAADLVEDDTVKVH